MAVVALQTIPAELRELRQWVLWRSELTDKGKPTKVPYQAAKPYVKAASTRPANWASFDDAMDAYDADRDGGIGFVFTGTKYAGVDLDHVRDAETGVTVPAAKEIVAQFDTYTELSQSKTGVHIIFVGEMPGKGRKVPGGEGWDIEAYSTGRFFCFTGARVGKQDAICERQEQLDALLATYFAEKPKGSNGKTPLIPAGITAVTASDAQLIEMMLGSQDGKFARIWRGGWEDEFSSQSEADLWLCGRLCFYTWQDTARMDGLFRQSGLMREKWDSARGEKTYGAWTVEKAISEHTGGFYKGRLSEPPADDLDGIAGEVLQAEGLVVKPATVAPMGAKPETVDPETGEVGGPAEVPARTVRALEQEASHAAILHRAWVGRVRYAEHLKRWRKWTGKVWAEVPDRVIADAACKVLCRAYADQLAAATYGSDEAKRLLPLFKDACKMRSVLGGLFFFGGKEGVNTLQQEWDPEPYLLNCADGILDMRTRELRPHDPAAMCTRVTAWKLGSDADVSTGAWERHLELCLPSADVRRQVQRDLGRSLVDAVLEHSLSIWYGIGRNGKSTTAEALLKGLAEYGMEAAKDLLVQTHNERHTTEIAELAGRRLVFVEETTDGKSLDESQVKRLTGGGNKRAHFMRQDNINVPQTFSLALLVNHKPKVSGGDPGIWERLRLVPWTVRIPFSEQRPQEEVVAELDADGAWMLRWLVAGFADWQADHHWIADEVKAATHDYRAEEDELQRFVDGYCTEDARATVPMGDLYDAYVVFYLGEHPGWKDPTKKALGAILRDRGITAGARGHDNVRVYRGITLKTTPEPAQTEWDEA